VGGNGDGDENAGDDADGCSVDGLGVVCRSREQTIVSIHPHVRAEMCTCGRAGAGRTFARIVSFAVQEGPPSPAVRLGPTKAVGRAARSRAHALSGQAEARKSCRRGNYATCTRARPWDLPNACANESLSCGDHEDMRRVLGRARIEAHYTWLFEWPWRSAAGNPHLKVG
jgi:hypothetical protein